MGAPTDYDLANLTIRPVDLDALAGRVETTSSSLDQHTTAIFTALGTLTDGWNSDSAVEARDFGDKLLTACKAVFGSDETGAPPGALANYAGYLRGAAGGFDYLEHQLVEAWQGFVDALNGTSSSKQPHGGPGTPPSADAQETALTYDHTAP